MTNVTATANTVTFTFNKAYNQHWILYNELAQITPLPVAWDITAAGGAPGSGGCSSAAYGTADAACTKVYTFLSDQAGYNPNNPSAANNSLSTYATNPLWQVVDGPWKLKSFNPDGENTMVPNSTYSGPIKPTVKSFTELPYTSGDSEFNALVGGNLSVGYVDETEITEGTTNPVQGGSEQPAAYRLLRHEPVYSFCRQLLPDQLQHQCQRGRDGQALLAGCTSGRPCSP